MIKDFDEEIAVKKLQGFLTATFALAFIGSAAATGTVEMQEREERKQAEKIVVEENGDVCAYYNKATIRRGFNEFAFTGKICNTNWAQKNRLTGAAAFLVLGLGTGGFAVKKFRDIKKEEQSRKNNDRNKPSGPSL